MDRNQLNTIWHKPLCQPILANNQVHIWRTSLDFSTAKVNQLATFLSIDELARANRFHFPEHKKRFIAARGILRQLLGNYMQISPDKLKFEYGYQGKPRLATSMGNSSLQFNVSHSFKYALYGFANHHLVGIDIEFLREMKDPVELAKRFFSNREYQLIVDLTNKEQQQKFFFKLWTAKEAYLKALGTGLSSSLTDIEISLDGANTKLLAIRGNTTTVNNWSMYHFVPAANYIAVIIINTQIPKQQINFWNWYQG